MQTNSAIDGTSFFDSDLDIRTHIYFDSRLNDNHLDFIKEVIKTSNASGVIFEFVENRLHAFVLWKLLENPCKESISAGLTQAEEFYRNSAEYAYYVKTFSFANADKLKHIGSNEIRSSGYIVDSLEAALWCLLTTDSYKECVLKAVNLGYDADTIAAIAGGLAGALYGYEAIPQKWRDCLIKREYIEELCERAFKNTRQY